MPEHTTLEAGIGMISAANLGGAASSAYAERGEAEAVAQLAPRLAAEGMAPLSGCTPESLARDLVTHRAEWDFTKAASLGGARPVLLIHPRMASETPHRSSGRGLTQVGNRQVTEMHLAMDHSYSDKRVALGEAVLARLSTVR